MLAVRLAGLEFVSDAKAAHFTNVMRVRVENHILHRDIRASGGRILESCRSKAQPGNPTKDEFKGYVSNV